MNDQQLLRYSRQIMLPQVDIEGQEQLLNAHVLIIGAGGLGSPASLYLAAAGVGTLTLYDDDQVDLSNLQRQITHYTDDIGTDKVISSQQTLNKINPDTRVFAIKQRLQGEQLEKEVLKADIVLDCTDNFSTRFEINKACVKHKKPLVSGAAIRFEGQVSVFVANDDSPCYNCLYAESGEELQNCATNGVISPITGIIGSVQAMEAMKLIMGIGETLAGRLLLLDGLSMQWNEMKLRKNKNCPTCRN
ncbi:adenylyltransferase and sulfurtransferase [Bathymodiolus platifrons methanotrophic gill symbiont]|uniref:HesA/MoeB/ThiF family protein n=1 Tax=Bathymodiolus platifrons methanotrophic gill symbiont TaxID=113268 RepID=UPI000B416FC4|nr:molybdopterin-synthase adenylyltransferase MoeB [Bathymodiolus platifrons methanotrophic gill symbiont]MCK5870732.1 molybdopterin-synthase adenylyltransferase MoeB [Methyloprofundus sp.]TXK95029.1 molybdopterin-synthase adenylyltransferase MoeB [Methylococcaceae bacterium HT1]TXK96773.1 molybdopterin-synthase adenylyltransferase MoeB [Methylococcaceae bacterium CS4]TXL01013.1 molybdopterin-synthase adenylyltransferase MoeB [Methylococcaceae bacterium CS5]TXL08354.1 molybdopterin-synthase ad